MLPLRHVTRVCCSSVTALVHTLCQNNLDCSGQVTEQLRGGNGSISAKSRSAFKPQDGDLAWLHSAQGNPSTFTPTGHYLSLTNKGQAGKENWQHLFLSPLYLFAFCSLLPTNSFLQEKEDTYIYLTVCSGKQTSPATRSGKDKCPCPEGINKPKITEHSTYPSSLLKIDQATLLEGKRRDQRRASLVPWHKCTKIHTSSS